MMEIKRESEAFVTVDGLKLYNLLDLLIWLYNTKEENFKYHVEKENHFYTWIYNSLEEKELAEKIKDIKDRIEMIKIIEEYMKKFEKIDIKIDKEIAESEFIKEYILK